MTKTLHIVVSFFASALNYKEETPEKNPWKIIGKRCKINEKML